MRGLFLAMVMVVAWAPPVGALATLVFSDRPVVDVIREIERSTPWRFLYRDALVTGRRVSLATTRERLAEDLSVALGAVGLALSADAERQQILLFQAVAVARVPSRIRGRVVDAASGAALPFATVSWWEEAGQRGVVADVAGSFGLAARSDSGPLELTASYLGYEPRDVSVPLDGSVREVTMRLPVRAILSPEVVVFASMLTSDLDTTWHHLLRPGALAPLGESGLIRSLQSLPAVSITPAMSDGMIVRGSQADGFQVLLDGMPVYSLSHLFGLFDAFNDDALQTVGLFYGIAPAAYQAPPGGTVALVTRPGAGSRPSGSIGVSNTAVRGTLQGPLPWGNWLVSARRSYLSSIDWIGSSDLIALGLDLGRETSAGSGTLGDPGEGLRLLGSPEAIYYDAHARVDLESSGGTRLTVTGYIGGDTAAYDAQRSIKMQMPGHGAPFFRLVDADTDSEWGAGTASAQLRRPGRRGFSSTLVGFTRYESRYRKEDYVYTGRGMDSGPGSGMVGAMDPPVRRIGPMGVASDLHQWRAGHEQSAVSAGGFTWTIGGTVDAYSMRLEEESLGRNEFDTERDATLIDVYSGLSTERGRMLGADVGLRAHFFGLRSDVGISPRISVKVADGSPISGSIGYSRNYQYLHRISLENRGFADLWVLSAEGERPTTVDYVTASVLIRPARAISLQVEGYVKRYADLRLHQTVVEARGFVTGGLLLRPWLNDASGHAQGLEAMLTHRAGPFVFSHGYSWSATELSHPLVLGGAAFAAPWDRRHQYTLTLRADLGRQVSASAAWMVATGNPNALRYLNPAEAERLPVYHRLDLSVEFRPFLLDRALSARMGLFNAYDRNNTWYRTEIPILMETPGVGSPVQTVPVDVYDLGLQPSFDLRYRF